MLGCIRDLHNREGPGLLMSDDNNDAAAVDRVLLRTVSYWNMYLK